MPRPLQHSPPTAATSNVPVAAPPAFHNISSTSSSSRTPLPPHDDAFVSLQRRNRTAASSSSSSSRRPRPPSPPHEGVVQLPQFDAPLTTLEDDASRPRRRHPSSAPRRTPLSDPRNNRIVYHGTTLACLAAEAGTGPSSQVFSRRRFIMLYCNPTVEADFVTFSHRSPWNLLFLFLVVSISWLLMMISIPELAFQVPAIPNIACGCVCLASFDATREKIPIRVLREWLTRPRVSWMTEYIIMVVVSATAVAILLTDRDIHTEIVNLKSSHRRGDFGFALYTTLFAPPRLVATLPWLVLLMAVRVGTLWNSIASFETLASMVPFAIEMIVCGSLVAAMEYDRRTHFEARANHATQALLGKRLVMSIRDRLSVCLPVGWEYPTAANPRPSYPPLPPPLPSSSSLSHPQQRPVVVSTVVCIRIVSLPRTVASLKVKHLLTQLIDRYGAVHGVSRVSSLGDSVWSVAGLFPLSTCSTHNDAFTDALRPPTPQPSHPHHHHQHANSQPKRLPLATSEDHPSGSSDQPSAAAATPSTSSSDRPFTLLITAGSPTVHQIDSMSPIPDLDEPRPPDANDSAEEDVEMEHSGAAPMRNPLLYAPSGKKTVVTTTTHAADDSRWINSQMSSTEHANGVQIRRQEETAAARVAALRACAFARDVSRRFNAAVLAFETDAQVKHNTKISIEENSRTPLQLRIGVDASPLIAELPPAIQPAHSVSSISTSGSLCSIVSGEAMRLATRLSELALPGSILVSGRLRQLVKDAYVLAELHRMRVEEVSTALYILGMPTHVEPFHFLHRQPSAASLLQGPPPSATSRSRGLLNGSSSTSSATVDPQGTRRRKVTPTPPSRVELNGPLTSLPALGASSVPDESGDYDMHHRQTAAQQQFPPAATDASVDTTVTTTTTTTTASDSISLVLFSDGLTALVVADTVDVPVAGNAICGATFVDPEVEAAYIEQENNNGVARHIAPATTILVVVVYTLGLTATGDSVRLLTVVICLFAFALALVAQWLVYYPTMTQTRQIFLVFFLELILFPILGLAAYTHTFRANPILTRLVSLASNAGAPKVSLVPTALPLFPYVLVRPLLIWMADVWIIGTQYTITKRIVLDIGSVMTAIAMIKGWRARNRALFRDRIAAQQSRSRWLAARLLLYEAFSKVVPDRVAKRLVDRGVRLRGGYDLDDNNDGDSIEFLSCPDALVLVIKVTKSSVPHRQPPQLPPTATAALGLPPAAVAITGPSEIPVPDLTISDGEGSRHSINKPSSESMTGSSPRPNVAAPITNVQAEAAAAIVVHECLATFAASSPHGNCLREPLYWTRAGSYWVVVLFLQIDTDDGVAQATMSEDDAGPQQHDDERYAGVLVHLAEEVHRRVAIFSHDAEPNVDPSSPPSAISGWSSAFGLGRGPVWGASIVAMQEDDDEALGEADSATAPAGARPRGQHRGGYEMVGPAIDRALNNVAEGFDHLVHHSANV